MLYRVYKGAYDDRIAVFQKPVSASLFQDWSDHIPYKYNLRGRIDNMTQGSTSLSPSLVVV